MIGCIGSGRLVLEGLASAPELSVEGEGACRTGLSRVGPGIIHRGRRSVSDRAVLEGLASAPELSVGGEGACRTGLVASTPELSVGVEGACRTGLVASMWGGGGAVCGSLAER